MVTNLKEDKKNKCQQYWPESGSTQSYGPFQVTLADEEVYTDYTIRTLQLEVRRTSFIDHTQRSHYINSNLTTVPCVNIFYRKAILYLMTAYIIRIKI